jgi:hypothetical protein
MRRMELADLVATTPFALAVGNTIDDRARRPARV